MFQWSEKIAWETVLKQRYPLLATLVDRMMSMHAISCSSERLWSSMRWIYRENRTRLAVERAKKMAFISANRRLLRKRKAPEGKEEDGMDLLLEIAIDDPEPSVQEWLWNIIKLIINNVVFLFLPSPLAAVAFVSVFLLNIQRALLKLCSNICNYNLSIYLFCHFLFCFILFWVYMSIPVQLHLWSLIKLAAYMLYILWAVLLIILSIKQ